MDTPDPLTAHRTRVAVRYITGDVHPDDAHGSGSTAGLDAYSAVERVFAARLARDLANYERAVADGWLDPRDPLDRVPRHRSSDHSRDDEARDRAERCHCGTPDMHRTRDGFVLSPSGRHAAPSPIPDGR